VLTRKTDKRTHHVRVLPTDYTQPMIVVTVAVT
jgi:hypothetical protein